ncbi:MAG: hypothetical protein PF487_04075 [Bacteroidales bacterium]|jgi:hypothetical protein|nr:hypothetical protein [Bacteroidales bacterium]
MKNTLSWILAIAITLSSAIFQKLTGPTYPIETSISLNNINYDLKMLRSHGGKSDCKLEFPIEDSTITGKIYYRHYPTNEKWDTIVLQSGNGFLTGYLPNQPPAGKLEYYISFTDNDSEYQLFSDTPIKIRFKGKVPIFVLIPHIFFMFIAMLLSTLAGIYAIFNNKKYKLYGVIAFSLLIIGGLILGPVIQHYAFGQAWTGIPLGWDLTDNKTLFAVIAWIIALIANFRKDNPKYTIAAAIILLLIFSIPHSMFGSELDYSSGKVISGFITFYF